VAFLAKTLRAVLAPTLIASVLMLGPTVGSGDEKDAGRFEVATIRFEQNVTDKDVEVVFEINGEDEGLSRLLVMAPNGSTVADVTAASKFGLKQFVFESPEPRDAAALKAAYPEGKYTFEGTTVGGEALEGTCTLTHALPAAVKLVAPLARATDVQIEGLQVRWNPIQGASGYIVELEQEDTGFALVVNLPGTASTLALPAGLLTPATEYVLGIGAVADGGNRTFMETSFMTAD
jgi:hypothetical protein